MSFSDILASSSPELFTELLDAESELLVGGIGSGKDPGNFLFEPGIGSAGNPPQATVSFDRGSVFVSNPGTTGPKGIFI